VKIFSYNENEISVEQEIYSKDFFIQKLSPELVTIILNDLSEFPLRDNMGYLAIKLVMKRTRKFDTQL
jgi:polyphosphate kinase